MDKMPFPVERNRKVKALIQKRADILDALDAHITLLLNGGSSPLKGSWEQVETLFTEYSRIQGYIEILNAKR